MHAYGVGQAKSDTGSWWGVFQDAFRAEHEPSRQELCYHVVRHAGGNLSDPAALVAVGQRFRAAAIPRQDRQVGAARA